jgi:hypothetical protein
MSRAGNSIYEMGFEVMNLMDFESEIKAWIRSINDL